MGISKSKLENVIKKVGIKTPKNLSWLHLKNREKKILRPDEEVQEILDTAKQLFDWHHDPKSDYRFEWTNIHKILSELFDIEVGATSVRNTFRKHYGRDPLYEESEEE